MRSRNTSAAPTTWRSKRPSSPVLRQVCVAVDDTVADTVAVLATIAA